MTTQEDKLLNLRAEERPLPQSGVAKEQEKANNRESVLEELLSKVKGHDDWVEVETPSRTMVQIRPITYEDENTLRTSITAGNPKAGVEALYTNCIKADWDNLYMFDRNYLMYKLREISYGNTYKIQGNCSKCNDVTELNLNLSELPVKEYTGDGTITITLPDSEVTAVLRIPNSNDQKLFDNLETVVRSMWRFVVSLNGETDTDIIQSFLAKTTLKDIGHVRREVYELDYGLTDTCWFQCVGCGQDNEIQIPLNESFFSVS